MEVFSKILDELYLDPNAALPLPHDYVINAYRAYHTNPDFKNKDGKDNNALNGYVFELIFYCLLVQNDIAPFFTHTQLSYVPHIEYDLVLYAIDDKKFEDSHQGASADEKRKDYDDTPIDRPVKIQPICISIKTSTRERFKQADLEAYILKNVHRNADCYLVVGTSDDGDAVNAKVEEKSCLGLNKAVAADTEEFDDLIEMLRDNYTFVKPKAMPVYQTGHDYPHVKAKKKAAKKK